MSDAGSALGIAGGALSAVGDIYQGESTAASLDAQAQLNQENSALALQQGAFDSYRQGLQVSSRLGSIKAGFGANGIASTSGSVLDVMQASAAKGAMDVENIYHGAQVRAINYQNEASMEQLGANNALNASYLNAIGVAVGSGAKAFGSSSSTASNTPDVESTDG